MKVLVLLAMLLFPSVVAADCPAPVYSFRATEVVPQPHTKSCGAAPRMLKDRHRVKVRNDLFYVDGMKWGDLAGSHLPGEAYLAFHQGQKVWLTLWLYANDNRIIGLYALHDDGRDCVDVVRLEGERL